MPAILVTGAGRGLGLEFVRQYAAAGWSVIATVRQHGDGDALRTLGARVELLDMRDFGSFADLGKSLAGQPLDLFVANAGMTSPGEMRTAEEAERFLEVLAVNSVAPTVLASLLLPNVIAAQGRMIAITSQMGSIADNGSGGWLAYRASKAALNAAWKTLAVEWASKPIAMAMLHPGWVQTDMGGRAAPLTPEDSVAGMRQVIEGLGTKDKGQFLNYRGEVLPW
jgi:NAD(P)-dependent dehydrogenase (short-subunit alcohol dehydrogenase family)